MATRKEYTLEFQLADNAGPQYTVPQLVGSASDLTVKAKSATITVTVVDAAAGIISINPHSSFTTIDFIAGQDTPHTQPGWGVNPQHPLSQTEADYTVDGSDLAHSHETLLGADDTQGLRKVIKDNTAIIGATAADGLQKKVGDLETSVGTDDTQGLRKAVKDNADAIGADDTQGLRKSVVDNTTAISGINSTIGADDTEGLRLRIADLETALINAVDTAAAAKQAADAAKGVTDNLFDTDGIIKSVYLPDAVSGLPTDFFNTSGRINESYITADVLNRLKVVFSRADNRFSWAFTVKNFKGKTVDIAPGNSAPLGLPKMLRNIQMRISPAQDHIYFRTKLGSLMGDTQAYVWSKPHHEGMASWHKKFTLREDSEWQPEGKGAGGVPISLGGFNDGALNPRMRSSIQLLVGGSFFVDMRFDQHKDGDDTTFSVNAYRITEVIN